jgi:CHAT domain-containing protein
VVATLWPVDDWATAAFMERFYEGIATGEQPVRAIAKAQRAMREAPATAHPFFWAGFIVIAGADSERARAARGAR